MPVLIWICCVLAALAVLCGVVVAVTGRGGGMARFESDHPSLDLVDGSAVGGLSPRSVALLQLPLSMWGYHVRAVDEVLARLAAEISMRDRRIAELQGGDGSGGGGTAPADAPDASPPSLPAAANGQASDSESVREP